MNDDPISRQAAIKAVHDAFDECLVWDESGEATADEVERVLEELPSAEKHGRWIRVTYPDGSKGYKCSACGGVSIIPTSYCGNCGAKMERSEE